MFTLKPISHESINGALAKAERYRLLNEPGEAESICLDILEIDATNEEALISLTLALTDQIPHDPEAFAKALATTERLGSAYDRAYYAGIAWERRAKARLHTRAPGGSEYVHEWLVRAMKFFSEAEGIRPAGNDDSVLRWNACARFLMANPRLQPRVDEAVHPILSE